MRKLLCTGSKIYLYVFWLLFFYKQLLLPPCPASPALSLYLAHSFSLCTYDPPTLATPLPACFAGVCKHFHVWKAQTPWTSFVAFFNVGVCVCVCFWICVCVCVCPLAVASSRCPCRSRLLSLPLSLPLCVWRMCECGWLSGWFLLTLEHVFMRVCVLVSVCATPSGVFKALNHKAKEKRRKTPLALAKGEREEAQMLWLPTFL